jgi:hypothetical protein
VGCQGLMGEGIVEFGDCTAFERAMDFGGTHAEAFGEVAVPPLAILPEVSFEEDGDVLWFEHGIYSLLLLFYIRKLRIYKVRVTIGDPKASLLQPIVWSGRTIQSHEEDDEE